MEKIVIVSWKIKESEAARIFPLLPRLVNKTRGEAGNISYTIYQAEGNPCDLILHEEYINAEAVEAHKNSDHYKRIVVDQILPYLELPDVQLVIRLF